MAALGVDLVSSLAGVTGENWGNWELRRVPA
jgi:hypothetical protein